MAPPLADRIMSRSSQARLSELLGIVVQAMRAIDDEFGGAMGPNGEAWDQLLNHMLPGSSWSGSTPSFVQITAPADTPTQSASDSAPVHPESSTSNAPESNQTLPDIPKKGNNLTPTRPNVNGAAAIPAAATPKDLTEDQRQAEWKLIVHYMDTRSKISQDQLARIHAAFVRWFGWAPSKEEMQKAREIARAGFTIAQVVGPWCSPFATEIWLKATRDRSIAKIRELKKTNWNRADRLAAYVGVKLKQEDKPKPKPKEATKDAASSSAPAMKSLLVKLKVKADASTSGLAQPQPQPQPQTAPQNQMQGNVAPPEQQNAVIPVSNASLQPLQASSTQQQLGPDNDFTGYVHQTLPDGFDHHTQVATPTIPAGSFGIDPRMTMLPGPAGFPEQFMNPAPLLGPMSAYPVGIPAASGWVNPIAWVTKRAASLGRSLLASSQGQADGSARSGQLMPAASHDPGVDAMDIVDIVPAAAKRVQPVEEESDDDADPNDQLHNEMLMHSSANDDADPSDQLRNEMLMHSSPSPKDALREKEAEKEKELEEKQVPAPSGPKQKQAVVAKASLAKKKAKQLPTVPTAKAAEKKSKAAKPAAPVYNYGADLTPDPRANALVAYIVAAWKITNKQNLVEDAAAMQQLGAHATAAIPFLIQDSQAKRSTRGMFRWGEQFLTWEMTLKKLDKFAETRALQKEVIEKGRGEGSTSAVQPDDATRHIDTSSTTAQPSTSQTTTPPPPVSTLPPKHKPRRNPYPDASLVAISTLTPDARANAFAAHLAETFYHTHGIDLMADDAGSRRLMLHATHNEHRLRGVKEVSNYEMNFHANKDLSWKITGFRLDALEQDWLKRFPPDESEGEEDQQEEESADGGEDGDVEMGGTAEPDIDKDTNGQADAQQPGAEQLRETSMASSGLSSVPSGILSPVERPSPAPSASSSSSVHSASSARSASAATVVSKKRGRSEQPDDTTTATTAEPSDPAVAISAGALGSPVPSSTAATATASATATTAADTNNDNDTASEPQQPPAKKQRLSSLESLPQPSVSPLSPQPVPRLKEEEEMKEEKDAAVAAAAPLAGSEARTAGTGSADSDEKEAVQEGGQAAGAGAGAGPDAE